MWMAADEIEVFESAWNWDHFYPLAEPYDGPNLEGWTMLAALAQATRAHSASAPWSTACTIAIRR